MALWDDLLDEVYVHTKRPDLVARTELALRHATRAAHKTGKYWRDLVTQAVPVTLTEVQSVDLTALTRFRQVATVGPATQPQVKYTPVDIDDLLDHDGYL
jgi:hypothetical protein